MRIKIQDLDQRLNTRATKGPVVEELILVLTVTHPSIAEWISCSVPEPYNVRHCADPLNDAYFETLV